MQGVAIGVLASVMPPEPKYDASVHEKLMPISGDDVLSHTPAVNCRRPQEAGCQHPLSVTMRLLARKRFALAVLPPVLD